MKVWPNMLLIAGTSRNVGKTTVACNIIEQISQHQKVIGIKITPHFHADGGTCIPFIKREDLIIAEETSKVTGKDSSKMLAAGAFKVYYVQSIDNQLKDVTDYLMALIPQDMAVVCESAALRDCLIPGQFIVMSRSNSITKNSNMISLADIHILDFKYDLTRISFTDGLWNK